MAMSISGTDIIKEAADLLIVEENFTTVSNTFTYGRHLYEVLYKYTHFIVISNLALIIIMALGAAIFGKPVLGAV